jgi:hypothetical protein
MLKNRTLNTIKLSNGEEIITEKFEEINSNVIKSEVNVIILRNMLEQYQNLCHTLYESTPNEERSIKYSKIAKYGESLMRFLADLTSNIIGALEILSNNNINSNIIDKIK